MATNACKLGFNNICVILNGFNCFKYYKNVEKPIKKYQQHFSKLRMCH